MQTVINVERLTKSYGNLLRQTTSACPLNADLSTGFLAQTAQGKAQ